MNPRFKYLVSLFRKLPGVGPRQAARFVLSLLNRDEAELAEFGQALSTLKQSVKFCQECSNLADNSHCLICSNAKRDPAQILVVEKVTDLDSIERTGLYRGRYHVLGGAISPVDGILPETLSLGTLKRRVTELAASGKIPEIILATSITAEGETTALYIQELLKDTPAAITRLARGLSSGANLEYADEGTLKHALEQRK